MVYADFTYYQNEYLGQIIEEDEFARFALRASQFLDYYTQGRASKCKDLPSLKMACCAIADQYKSLYIAQQTQISGLSGEPEVQSETVGDWTRTYRNQTNTAADIINATQSDLAKTAQMYLAHTGLLYRGRGRCCY